LGFIINNNLKRKRGLTTVCTRLPTPWIINHIVRVKMSVVGVGLASIKLKNGAQKKK
jgi:hypothetical protein